MTDHLRFCLEGRIATITLDRPERMNAFTFAMIDAWVEAIAECRRNDDIRALIVTGAGAAFCSGGDIVEMKERLEHPPERRKSELWGRIQRIPLALEDFDKPVLVAVNGAATGAGMDLALMGDLRYAAASARFAETYVRVALVPGAGGAHFLPRLVGTAKALELFWTGDFVDAAEAERIGLVNKVLPDAELLPHVRAVAARIAEAPALSVRFIKRAVLQGMRGDLRTNLDLISSHYAIVTAAPDHREAVEAFIAKRKPRFQ
ncbi:MAG: enoyl-CoA hydratase/isomerase family protein [Alphaproteobacteria bacterium]|nr:enoyl-CoA hydratase/isomerase family protein [Alphaproteobacteria bacterium]